MKPLQLFAVSAPGLEQFLAQELREIGIAKCKVEEGGVAFHGDIRVLQRANLHLRTALRILVRVARFHASAFHELERNAMRVRWSEYMPPGKSVVLRVTCRKSKLYHSDAVAERIAGAVSERTSASVFSSGGESDGASESGSASETVDDRQLFVVRLFHDECTISADSSGAHLHMRGYREAIAKAPLRETLAAGLIRASGWSGVAPLVDPMCGAGTIPIEAALIARRIAPGLSRASRESRAFAFQSWPGHDISLWNEEVSAARMQIVDSAPARIVASDRDAGAIEATLSNARRAGVEKDLDVEQKAVSGIVPPATQGAILCNPPYGKRVGEEDKLRDLYAVFGNVLRTEWNSWRLTMLSGNSALERQMGLKFEVVARTSNGGIPVRVIKADVK